MMQEIGKPLPMETLPRDELEKLQNRRIRATVRAAYEATKFYRELFNSLKIDPNSIRSREDLERSFEKGLVLTPELLISRYGDLIPSYFTTSQIPYLEVQTSGFTGPPKKIRWTIPPILSNEVLTLTFNACRLIEGDKVLLALAPYPYSSGILTTLGLKSYIHKIEFYPEWNVENRKPLTKDEIINKISSFGFTYIVTSPTTALEIADEMIRIGLEPSKTNVRKIMVGGEASEKERKDKISNLWNAEVFDVLGTTEAGLFGYECDRHDGMHIAESRILYSIVNPEKLEVLEEGEEGNPLITTLYEVDENPGMFLINYCFSGDATKIVDKKGECECGRRLIRIDYPKRVDEMANIRGVKLYGRAPEKASSVKDYLPIEWYSKNRGLRRLEIRVVPEEGYTKEHVINDVWKALLSSNPHAYILLKEGDVAINVVTPEKLYEGLEIPRGKRKRLIRKTED
jgi:phenylacetate-CoA ligase